MNPEERLRNKVLGQLIRENNLPYYNDNIGQRVLFYMIIRVCYTLLLQGDDANRLKSIIDSFIYIFNFTNSRYPFNEENIDKLKNNIRKRLDILEKSFNIKFEEGVNDDINNIKYNEKSIKNIKENIIFPHSYNILMDNFMNKIPCDIEKLCSNIIHSSRYFSCKLRVTNNERRNRLVFHPYYGV